MKKQTIIPGLNIFLFFVALMSLSLCTNNPPPKKPAPTAVESEESTSYPGIGEIERLDPALDAIIPADAKIELIGGGMSWSEGPVWIPEKKWLLCSDVPKNRIHKWTEKDGLQLFLEPSGFTGAQTDSRESGSNGLTLDHQGRLTLCQHGDRRVARYTGSFDEPTPSFETLVDRYEGKKFNSPNDLVFDRKGNLYFTDPPYGLSKEMMNDPRKELEFQGVYRYSVDGQLELVTKEMSRPNGIALSPDEKTLYVANSDKSNAIWMAFPISEEQEIGDGKVFYDATDLTQTEKGLPDGLKIDANGNLFATGLGGLWIFSPEGKVLGKIKAGKLMANCGFDDTGKTLYITADDALLRVKM